ncbi:hypothetical protein, partial [uncultured Alteromonas sp.]|uniref:hypothetical protein n=1 Tax=uncultured Alteromonas sp. TaxID=179113 RepID=UPI0025CCADEA
DKKRRFQSPLISPQQNHKKAGSFNLTKVKAVPLGIRQKAETSITINFATTEPQKKQEVLTFKSKDSTHRQ